MYKKIYVDKINDLPEPYDAKLNKEAFEKMANGDTSIKKDIIDHNLRFVLNQIYNYFSKTSYETNELFSIGTIGLIKAIDSFDIKKGNAFATYATRCIHNEILMFMRHEKKFSKEESMNKSLYHDKDGKEIILEEIIADNNINILDDYIVTEEIENNEKLIEKMKEILNFLKERDKQIILYLYGLTDGKKHSQSEAANKFNLSQSIISRIERKCLKLLKEILYNEMNTTIEYSDFDTTEIDPLLNSKLFIEFINLFPEEMHKSYCIEKGIRIKNKKVSKIINSKLTNNSKQEIKTMESHLKFMIDEYFNGIKQNKNKKEILESLISKMKNRSLLFRFSEYSNMEIIYALRYLTEEEQQIIIKRHGQNLNNFFSFSKKKYQKQFRKYTLAVQNLEIILFLIKNKERFKKDLEISEDKSLIDNLKYLTIKEKNILCSGGGYTKETKTYYDILAIIKRKKEGKICKVSPLFQKYAKEEIRMALPILSKEELILFLSRHGENLEQKNPWPTDQKSSYYYRRYAKIVKKIIKHIESKKEVLVTEFCLKYGFNSVSEAKETIALLAKSEQDIIYLKWGEDLNFVKSFPRNNIKKSFAEYSWEYEEAIYHLKQIQKKQNANRKEEQIVIIDQPSKKIKNDLLEEKLSLKKAEIFNNLFEVYQTLIDKKIIIELINKTVVNLRISNNEYFHIIENEIFMNLANQYKENIDNEKGHMLINHIKEMFLIKIKAKNPLYTKEKIAYAIEEVFKNYTGTSNFEFEITLYLKNR